MQQVSSATQADETSISHANRLKNITLSFAVLAMASIIIALLFNRETVLSYSIGYNLYGAERILGGEIPYRDFHTLYPPATVYLNAALFNLLGISLFNALLGVAAFKALTTLMIYLCGQRLMPRSWAIAAAAYSLFWLRPNGPFKAVPMHYGALFLALALYLFIEFHRRDKNQLLFVAGIALGALALFKHNIGAYALIGSMVIILFNGNETAFAIRNALGNYRRAVVLAAGFALPVIPVLVYMQMRGALAPMIKTLLFGPGEFLLSRLAALPSPLIPLIMISLLASCSFASRRLMANQRAVTVIWIITIAAISTFILAGDQAMVDDLIFYLPVFVISIGILVGIFGARFGINDRQILLVVTVMAAAAFMESFPRFAREQSIAATPFVVLLLFYLLHIFKSAFAGWLGEGMQIRMAMAVLPLTFLLMGSRLFFNTYFDGHLQFRSNTELNLERGRGVYFPEDKADEIISAVNYIQQRVPAGGHFFPQSYAGSSYLFLADRDNPSGAQFWGGVGVSDDERFQTLKALEEKQVELIVTSRKDLDAEQYKPMRDYIDKNFKLSKDFGETLILERGEKASQ